MSDNDTKHTSRTDWDGLANMTDEEIDYSDIPPLTDAFFERAQLFRMHLQAIELKRHDAAVLSFCRHSNCRRNLPI